jgi:hypothetical protein
MAAELCRHDMPAAVCADCRPKAAPSWDGLAVLAAGAEERRNGLGPWIEARYYGTCRGCGQRWEPGDLIAHDDDEDGWICTVCGSA